MSTTMTALKTHFVKKIIIIYSLILFVCISNAGEEGYVATEQIKNQQKMDLSIKPDDIVDLKKVAPKIFVKAAYFSKQNFVGEKINGYEAPKCYLQKAAAEALKTASEEIAEFGYLFIVYDCYRPQKAVDHFIEWSKDLDNKKTKTHYYPNIKKENLFKEGYIAEKSEHSSGHTVDITLGRPSGLNVPFELNMGTPFDFFDVRSHTSSQKNSREAIKNRLLLKMTLEKFGFINYSKEWWHFSFKNNNYKDVRFNFDVK